MRHDGIELADVWQSMAAGRARLVRGASHPAAVPRAVDAPAELSSFRD